MGVTGRNILLFVDTSAAIISKEEKLVYYPPQLISATPFVRTDVNLDTEENGDFSSYTSAYNSLPHVAPAAEMVCTIIMRGGGGL